MRDLTRACLTDLGIYVLQADSAVSELLATVGRWIVGGNTYHDNRVQRCFIQLHSISGIDAPKESDKLINLMTNLAVSHFKSTVLRQIGYS